MVPVRAGGRHVGGGRRVSGNHRQRGGLSVTEATLTITDDDTDDGNPPDDGGGNDDGDTRLPDLYIRDATVNEGDDARFAVRLSESSDRLVTVAYETVDRTAVAGSDYTSTSGLVRFEAGETSKTIAVPTIEDATVEETEGFTVQLSDPAGATVADGTALGTITDDDDPPGLSIDDAPAVREGETAEFVVRLSASSGVAATVSYRTFDGTALAGFDYVAAEGTLRFEPGETTHTVAVATLTDDLVEGPKDSPSSWAIRLGRRWPTAPLRAQSPTTPQQRIGLVNDIVLPEVGRALAFGAVRCRIDQALSGSASRGRSTETSARLALSSGAHSGRLALSPDARSGRWAATGAQSPTLVQAFDDSLFLMDSQEEGDGEGRFAAWCDDVEVQR